MRRLAIIAALAVLAALGLAAAVVMASPAASDPDLTLFCSQFVPQMQSTSYYAKWSRNGGERMRWETFRDEVCSGHPASVPSMSSSFGAALIAAGEMALPSDAVITTTSTSTATVTSTSTATSTTTVTSTSTSTSTSTATTTTTAPPPTTTTTSGSLRANVWVSP